MQNQILSILFQTASGPIFGASLEMMLDAKQTRVKKWMRILIWFPQYLFATIPKVFTSFSTLFPLFPQIIWLAIIIMVLAKWYEGAAWKKVLAAVVLYFAGGIGEIAFFFVPPLLGVEEMSMDFSQPDMMIGCFFSAMLTTAADVLVVAVWRHVQNKTSMLRYPWLLILLPLCLAAPMLQYNMDAWATGGSISLGNLISMLAAFVFSILLIFLLFNQASKDTLEKELAQTQYRAKLEQQHYRNIEARREEMAKIRHDYNNLLSSVLGLLNAEKTQEAKQALSELLTRVEQTREYQYCGIPIVNAILSEKQNVCKEQGIRLVTDLLLPEDSGIEQIDLCSVFSNLLDNAIRACGHLPQNTEKTISLTAATQGDYLIIRCDNLSVTVPGQHPEGSGYGMKILKDIAHRYKGSFTTEFENGVFSARLVLLAVRTANFAEK